MTSPNDKPRGALILRPNHSPVVANRGDVVVSRMVSEALEIARRQALQSSRKLFTVGRFELAEPDYRQICRWADELGKTPSDLMEELASLESEEWNSQAKCLETLPQLRIDNGTITVLVLDGKQLPIHTFLWEAELGLERLIVEGRMPAWPASAPLPSLKRLVVPDLSLTELDLSPVPGLTWLMCEGNQLTELDLRPLGNPNIPVYCDDDVRIIR